MSISLKPLGLKGVIEIVPERNIDARGFFSETWSAHDLAEAGVGVDFVQDNHSYSTQEGVFRGLHYQLPPYAQDKLVRVVRGAILDFAVDIRCGSPTFAKWVSLEVSARKWNQIYIPKGFAHGLLVLEAETEVIYKVSNPYSRRMERTIRFDDPDIGLVLPDQYDRLVLSEKDRAAPGLDKADLFDMEMQG
jgi:dTDP-4-dehydrorhamnose 3,5-epimerase